MYSKFEYCFILVLLGVVQIFCHDLTVNIPKGKVLGHLAWTYNGKQYVEFQGIPYAQPPLGNLRYEEPQPVQPWSGTWIANISTRCLQINHTPEPEGGTTEGNEDCLHLNVFVPGKKIQSNKKLDVIVHIHGGAFNFGHGQCYAGPKFLMDRDVILVTMNYRLGLLGFLSTEDENLPGNLGMKDQVMALRWIKNNIAHFGGNPDSITISGLSAGGASTHFHYLSPLSRGLFNRGISVSGCALNVWPLQENALAKTRYVGRTVGCEQTDTKELVKCLKGKHGLQIIEATRSLRKWLFNPHSPVALVVDKASKNPFLPEHPYKMLAEGNVNDVPWITSITTSEGLYPAADFAIKDHYLDDLEEYWEEYAPAILHYVETIPEHMKSEVAQKMKYQYLKGKPISKETYPEVIQLIGDRAYLYHIEMAARLQAKANKAPVYFYVYDYTGEERISFAKHFACFDEKYGVCHGDDVMFIFSDPFVERQSKLTTIDEKMKDKLLDMWISFAKNGNPGIDIWTPVSRNVKDPLNYIFIAPDQHIEKRTAEELGQRSFWETIPFEENEYLFKNNIKTEL